MGFVPLNAEVARHRRSSSASASPISCPQVPMFGSDPIAHFLISQSTFPTFQLEVNEALLAEHRSGRCCRRCQGPAACRRRPTRRAVGSNFTRLDVQDVHSALMSQADSMQVHLVWTSACGFLRIWIFRLFS